MKRILSIPLIALGSLLGLLLITTAILFASASLNSERPRTSFPPATP